MSKKKRVLADLLARYDLVEKEAQGQYLNKDEKEQARADFDEGKAVFIDDRYYKITEEVEDSNLTLLLAKQLDEIHKKLNVVSTLFIISFLGSIIAALIWLIAAFT